MFGAVRSNQWHENETIRADCYGVHFIEGGCKDGWAGQACGCPARRRLCPHLSVRVPSAQLPSDTHCERGTRRWGLRKSRCLAWVMEGSVPSTTHRVLRPHRGAWAAALDVALPDRAHCGSNKELNLYQCCWWGF
jgi:hypothetical protein